MALCKVRRRFHRENTPDRVWAPTNPRWLRKELQSETCEATAVLPACEGVSIASPLSPKKCNSRSQRENAEAPQMPPACGSIVQANGLVTARLHTPRHIGVKQSASKREPPVGFLRATRAILRSATNQSENLATRIFRQDRNPGRVKLSGLCLPMMKGISPTTSFHKHEMR